MDTSCTGEWRLTKEQVCLETGTPLLLGHYVDSWGSQVRSQSGFGCPFCYGSCQWSTDLCLQWGWGSQYSGLPLRFWPPLCPHTPEGLPTLWSLAAITRDLILPMSSSLRRRAFSMILPLLPKGFCSTGKSGRRVWKCFMPFLQEWPILPSRPVPPRPAFSGVLYPRPIMTYWKSVESSLESTVPGVLYSYTSPHSGSRNLLTMIAE